MHRPPDALGAALAWLRTHPDLPEQLRADGEPGRVSTRDGGVYPCLRVRYTPGGAGGLRWQVSSELQVELLDSLDATQSIGDSMRLELLQRCLWLLADLPDAEQPIPGRGEVVSLVEPVVSPALIPEPGVPNQARWLATVTVNAHPAPTAP